ncbi:MAG: VanZ family protein [Clostridium sp.]|nr:VanZ family protein [Clostridium sp.]
MANKLKKIISNVALIFICILISYMSCYKFLDNVILSISMSSNIFVAARIILALALFIFIKFIINKKVNSKYIDLLFCLYFILILMLTLFKNDNGWTGNINLNLLEVFKDIKSSSNGLILLVGNICMYIPIGIYIEYRFFNKKNTLKIGLFLIYIFLIELIQHIFKKGVFDIDDIILNLIGFLIGVFLVKGIKKLKNK